MTVLDYASNFPLPSVKLECRVQVFSDSTCWGDVVYYMIWGLKSCHFLQKELQVVLLISIFSIHDNSSNDNRKPDFGERRVNSCVTSDSETAYTEASLHGHDTTRQSAVYHQIPITAQFTEQEPVVRSPLLPNSLNKNLLSLLID